MGKVAQACCGKTFPKARKMLAKISAIDYTGRIEWVEIRGERFACAPTYLRVSFRGVAIGALIANCAPSCHWVLLGVRAPCATLSAVTDGYSIKNNPAA